MTKKNPREFKDKTDNRCKSWENAFDISNLIAAKRGKTHLAQTT